MEITIREEVHTKIMRWVNTGTDEVSGFGRVIRTETGLEVVSAYLLDQEVGGAHTDIDGASLAKLMYDTRKDEGELRYWWHSHVKMPVFWSGQDTATIKELGSHGWILASVFNQNWESRTALCYKTASEFGDSQSIADELELQILTVQDEELIAAWDAEYKAKVRQRKYATQPTPQAPLITRTDRQHQAAWDRYDMHDMHGYEQDWGTHGLWGYGSQVEAEALRIDHAEYVKMLNQWDAHVIATLEERLELAEKRGLLKETVS